MKIEDVSFCKNCYCLTNTIITKLPLTVIKECGKCGEEK